MKISDNKKSTPVVSFDTIIREFIAKYKNIFMEEIDGTLYIYKALNRKYYKDVVRNSNLSNLEKEEEVCHECILWPKDIDWDEVDAGIPTMLYEKILTESYLEKLDDIAYLIEANREDMEHFDIQMCCLITEAFPNYDIEEMEEWDMLRLCKVFSRAEWKLQTLRNFPLKDMADLLREAIAPPKDHTPPKKDKVSNEEILNKEMGVHHSAPAQPTIEHSQHNNTEKKYKVGNRIMSEAEYREFEQFKVQYPDIDFGADSMFTGFESISMNTTNPGLRTP